MTTTILAAQAAQGGSSMSFIILMIAMFAIMYFFMIRPQQKKQKEIQKFQNSIAEGTSVVTGGGIYGTVTKADGIKLEVKIAEGLTVTVNRATVRDVVNDEGEAAAPAPKAKKQSKTVEKK